ncbi:MAG TPA: hypothetical protein VFI47_12270 [Acidimicrobiales bacterium]|nr:hypothetical protein [Acidimicrobiales bacterium]
MPDRPTATAAGTTTGSTAADPGTATDSATDSATAAGPDPCADRGTATAIAAGTTTDSTAAGPGTATDSATAAGSDPCADRGTATGADAGTVVLTSRADVEAVLASPAMLTPPPPAALGAGSLARLRAAMARFTDGDAHPPRRAAVEAAVDRLVPAEVGAVARAATLARLTGGPVDALAAVAFTVPTAALGLALGVPGGEIDALVADVRQIVAVIGRGEPATPAADGAADRVLARFAGHPAGAVPVASLLYQNHDATAALTVATVVARHHGVPRRPALARTVRIAARGAHLGGTAVAAGATVVLDLDAAGLEFGAGRHRCPGRAVAEAVAGAIADALAEAGYRLLPDLVEHAPDGRPRTLPMAPEGVARRT